MTRYKTLIAYDGTPYHGWQVQEGLPTVAGVLEHTFARVFGKSISMRAVSRTDAGVHALGQIASFDCDPFADAHRIMHAWNNALPGTILIRSLQEVDKDLFRLHEVSEKIYLYHFFLERPLPWVSNYGWYYHKTVCLDRLQQALSVFVGTHNFRSFSTGDERGDDTIRTIDAINLTYLKRYNVYQIKVIGKKFLHHMVRRIVGASLDAASHPMITPQLLRDVLTQLQPHQTLTNAPAHGLVLYKVNLL
ncbi:MAG: tRNA pseudouridine(38-40) synthase TruA [Candidatus Babeliales bacterium]